MIPLDLNIEPAIETIEWENGFAVHASTRQRAGLLRKLIVLYSASGQPAVLDKINIVAGILMREMRICKRGKFWVDAHVTDETSFVHLQYECCLAFYELGRCVGNDALTGFATSVIAFADNIADSQKQSVWQASSIQKAVTEEVFHLYPFISLQPGDINKRSILRYFSFTIFSLKDILEEKGVVFAFPPIDTFFEKDSFGSFLEKYNQHLTGPDCKEVVSLHEYELFKMCLEVYFTDFNGTQAIAATAGDVVQLHPEGRRFSVSRNKSISIRGTILEGFPADGSVYTVFVYPHLHDRRVKEEILTEAEGMILAAFDKPASILAVINEMVKSLAATAFPMTKPDIRRRIRLFEKAGMLVSAHL